MCDCSKNYGSILLNRIMLSLEGKRIDREKTD